MDTNSVAFAPKILSGIDIVDQYWGGFYRGGSYVIYGRAVSGRSLLTLVFTQTGTLLEESCLYISPSRPKDLMIQAASVGFNLRQAYDAGLVKLMRIPPMLSMQDVSDDAVEKALYDLVTIIRQYRPARLVIDDFMPFVQFRSFDRFRTAFVEMLEQIDSLDTTLVLVMAEPANQQSRKVVHFVRNQMTGSVHIEMNDDDVYTTRRRLTLTPTIGHIRHKVVEFWDLADLVEPEEKHAAPSVQMPVAAQDVPPTGALRLGSQSALHQPQQPSGAFSVPLGRAASSSAPPTRSWEQPDRSDDYGGGQQPRPMRLNTPRSSGSGRGARTFEAGSQPSAQRPSAPTSTFGTETPSSGPAPGAMTPPPQTVMPVPAEPMPMRPAPPRYRQPEPVPQPRQQAAQPPAPQPTPPPRAQPRPQQAPPPQQPHFEPARQPEIPRQQIPVPQQQAPHSQQPPAPRPQQIAPQPQQPRPPQQGFHLADAPTIPPSQHQVQQQGGTASRGTLADRDAFRTRLQQHFNSRDVAGTPFVLLALRMDRSQSQAERPFDFEFILDLAQNALRPQDDLVVDFERERIIVLLGDSQPDESQRFFARLKQELRSEAPGDAEQLLHAVSAIVVPNGQPFANAEEFLTYALDEE